MHNISTHITCVHTSDWYVMHSISNTAVIPKILEVNCHVLQVSSIV